MTPNNNPDADQEENESVDFDEIGSVTGWLYNLPDEDNQIAIENIWERYFDRLVSHARHRSGSKDGFQDEEDFAIVAFTQFIKGAEQGSFKKLENRHDLWQILTMIASRRAIHAYRKRVRRPEINESVVTNDFDEMNFLDQVEDTKNEDILSAFYRDTNEMLSFFTDRRREIAEKKLMGYTIQEIATELEIGTATVERELRRIREDLLDVLRD